MIFNSLEFVVFSLVFFPIFLGLRGSVRLRNALLLVSSYVFYGWWDWRFLSLLAVSTGVDYVVGRLLEISDAPRRRLMLVRISLVTNLGILGFFKYFGFFVDSAVVALDALGFSPHRPTLDVVLPVGISFYTFQTLSYTLDVYWRKLAAERSLLNFAVFVSFWPQLVAGPIERAGALLTQIAAPTRLKPEDVHLGLHLAAWGMFKKTVIADNLARISDAFFSDPTGHGTVGALLGTLAFTMQIYADFSGYTDIARGLAKCMGFELRLNFALPYLSVSPSDFWTRWHISLSSWLRDYLYIPLGGNRGSSLMTYRNLMATMLLGGLWHGASWNFVLWGAFHGTILVLYRLAGVRDDWLKATPLRHGLSVSFMFLLTMVGWILFRCHTAVQIGEAFAAFMRFRGLEGSGGLALRVALSYAVVGAHWSMQVRGGNLATPMLRRPLGSAAYLAALVFAVLVFGSRDRTEFIYFQF